MAILRFIIGVLIGIFIGAYALLKKVSETWKKTRFEIAKYPEHEKHKHLR